VNESTLLARTLVDELCRSGVREAVLAPGSRSAPLAFALHAADAEGRIRMHVRLDERTAGFLALGMAKQLHAPVAVVTTSGTAVANLHPAVLEACHAGVPLVVASADRPVELLGTGANQTTDQVKIFGDAVRWFAQLPSGTASEVVRAAVARALSAALGTRTSSPGPVHLNVALRDPLVPGSTGWPADGRPGDAPWAHVDGPGDPEAYPLVTGPRTVVVAGDGAGPPARLLAEAGGWPLLAEPTSGARTGENPIARYRLLLGGAGLADRIDRVVVYGHPTLSRAVTALLSRPDVELVVVAPRGLPWPDVGNRAARVVPAARVAQRDDATWLDDWRAADVAVGRRVDALLDGRPGLSPWTVARILGETLPPAGLLVVGSSNPIRDLDLMMPTHLVGGRRKTIANRGLSGIDGTVSTAVGTALVRQSSRAFAYLGDLTFLHDSNGLLFGEREPMPDLTIVVVNDDGGSIFATLEQGAPEYASAFERVFATPTHADIAAVCAVSGTAYQRVDDTAALREALAVDVTGIRVLEVPVDRADRRAVDEELRSLT
jgi:2-succinyl-5-enolpyruvyl-6-hydroxy-3-cyclohexene-1-carboxylate synthase